MAAQTPGRNPFGQGFTSLKPVMFVSDYSGQGTLSKPGVSPRPPQGLGGVYTGGAGSGPLGTSTPKMALALLALVLLIRK